MNMNNLFFKTVNEDLSIYRPETTNEERLNLFKKGMELFTEYNPIIVWSDEYSLLNLDMLMIKDKRENLFMCRTNSKYCELPFIIPKNYDIFFETSTNIYDNYLQTINNLKGELFNLDDIDRCKKNIINKTNILCWSNSSIILNNILSTLTKSESENINIITFGSPIILPCYFTKYCINIYHEEDWVIDMVKSLFKLENKVIKLDIIYKCTIDNKKCIFIIISKKYFNTNIEAHRCVEMLF